MKMLIKAGTPDSHTQERAFAPRSSRDDALLDAHAHVARLEQALADRDKQDAKLRTDHEKALTAASEAAFERGLREAESLETERLTALEETLSGIGQAVRTRLAETERLAAVLARDCLEILFGANNGHREDVERLLMLQLERIDSATVVEVRVSRGDFPDPSGLQELKQRVAPDGEIQVIADATLALGQCHMVLRLGRMEIGLDQQWPVLRDILDQLAQPCAKPA
jgi:flagellar biosynthesis/type III secretory pathway protein FliH